MSMYVDLIRTIKKAKVSYKLTEDQTLELFINVMGCLEWDLDGIDYERDDWPDQERQSARMALFGN